MNICQIHNSSMLMDGEECPACKVESLELAYHDLRKAVGNLLSLSQAVDERNLERAAPSAAWTALSIAYNKCK
ncbi:MAG TPA: hypothetical protein VFI02_20665 [Armatimonadota bacterium]|nr:hypothetical protein [Armatimonadota bacterium]